MAGPAPDSPTPTVPARGTAPAPSETPAAEPQQRRQNPVAAVVQSTTTTAARAVEPVSPQVAATVQQTGETVAGLVGP